MPEQESGYGAKVKKKRSQNMEKERKITVVVNRAFSFTLTRHELGAELPFR